MGRKKSRSTAQQAIFPQINTLRSRSPHKRICITVKIAPQLEQKLQSSDIKSKKLRRDLRNLRIRLRRKEQARRALVSSEKASQAAFAQCNKQNTALLIALGDIRERYSLARAQIDHFYAELTRMRDELSHVHVNFCKSQAGREEGSRQCTNGRSHRGT